MLKKLLLTFSFVSIFSAAHAETCPGINDLKHNILHGWQIYSIDNGTLIQDPQIITNYEHNARTLGLAEWAKGSPEGEAHCYYFRGMDYGIAYLARSNLIPNEKNSAWLNSTYKHCDATKDDNCECHAGESSCEFISA